MNKFRRDNTDGYSQADLDALNRAWDFLAAASMLPEDDDLSAKSYTDHIAEKLLARYDAGCRGDSLVAAIMS